MTAKEAAEQRYLMRKEDRHNAFSYNDVTTFERFAFEAGATWKEAELQHAHLFGQPVDTTPVKTESTSVSYDVYESSKREVQQLQQRIKELEEQVEEANKQATAAWMYNRNANEKIRQMEEKEGKFAEWASGEGWSFRTDTQMWARFSHVDRDELECYECKTTSELWAEWDRCGSI